MHELLHLIGSLHPSDDVPVCRKVAGRLLQLLFSSLYSCWSVFGIRMLICEVTPAIWLKASVKVLLEGFKNTVHLGGAPQHQRTSEFKSYKYVRSYFQAILASLTVKWTQPWVRSGFVWLKCRKWCHFSIILFIYNIYAGFHCVKFVILVKNKNETKWRKPEISSVRNLPGSVLQSLRP